jgi:transcriptional regulator with XRE-family HTH domain
MMVVDNRRKPLPICRATRMADDPPASIVEQLRDAIRASGLSLNQLSIAAGIDRSQLSRFMLGQRDLTFEAVGQVCRALGVTLQLPEELRLPEAPQSPPEPPPAPPRRRGKK